MAGVRLSAIRAAVATVLEANSWVPTRHTLAQFGKDARSRTHRGYAIGFPGDQEHTRNRRGATRTMQAVMVVALGHKILADNVVSSTDTALDLFEDADRLIDTDTDRTGGFHLIPVRRQYRDSGDGTYLLAELEYELQYPHHTP